MGRTLNLTVIINILAIIPLLMLTGCSQHQQWGRVEHPGDYDLVKMGHTNLDGETFRVTKAHDKIFLSYPDTEGPSFFSTYLLKHTKINKGESVLDVGTGSGIQAVYAAENASHVLAIDITITIDEKFYVIIVNIPFPWYDKSQDYWKLQERFFQDVGGHLNPDGRIYLLAGILNNLQITKELIGKSNLRIMRIDMTYIDNKEHDYELLVYMIKHAPDSSTRNRKGKL